MLDYANILAFGLDGDGRVATWGRGMARLTGYESNDLVGEPLVDTVISGATRKFFVEAFQQALSGVEPEGFECQIRVKSGQNVDVFLNLAPCRNSAGKVFGVHGIGQDITQRKKKELNLRRLSADLAHLSGNAFFESASRHLAESLGIDFVLVGELAQNKEDVAVLGGYALGRAMDGMTYSLAGTPCENVIGKKACFYPSCVAELFPEDEILRELGIEAYMGVPLWDKNHQPMGIMVALHREVLTLQQGNEIEELLEIYSDRVTADMQRARAESERREAEARASMIVATVPECIKVLDQGGNLLDMNPAGLNIIEAESLEQVSGVNVLELVAPEYHERFQNGMAAVFRGETVNQVFEIIDLKGERHWMEQYAAPIWENEAENRVVKMLAVTRDITKRRKEDERIRSEESHFRTLFEESGDALMTLENGRFTSCNEAAIKLFGVRSKKEFVGAEPHEFSPPHQANGKASIEEAKKQIQIALQSGTNRFEWIHKRPSGEIFHCEVLVKTMPMRGKTGILALVRDITERKQAEQDRERVANDLTELIDTANAPIFGIDAQGLVTEWNQTAERITGYSKGDVMGQPLVAEFITEDYREAVSEVFDNALNGTETDNFEFPLYTKDGERVEVLLNATTRRDGTGKVVGVVGVGQDITERKQAEQDRERVANDLTQLIDTANAPIFGIDAQGLVTEWNQTAERITGYSKGDVMGQPLVAEFITEDYREAVSEVFDNALNGTETDNFEFPLYTKDGERVEVLLNATTRRDGTGKVVGVVGVGQDITERKQAEQDRERVANDLTQLIDTANAPIFGIDAQGLVTEWNQTAERITGYSKGDVMGQPLVAEFITEDYREAVSEVFDNALNGTETDNFEFPLYTKDGERVEVLLNATTRRDGTGKVVGVVGVGQDITERKQAEQDRERVANDLTQLIDTANAPIFGIDAQGLVTEWNQTAERITGYSKGDVMGQPLVAEFITEDYREAVSEVFDNALNGTETDNFEFPLYTKDGERVEVLLNATTRRDGTGKVVGVVGVGQDITERKQAEQDRERVANDLTQLIDTANAPIFGIDAQGLVTEWNQTAERITGYSKGDVMGQPLVAEFITEDYREAVSEVFDNALNGTETDNFEFPLYTKDGERVEVLLNATTRRDGTGKVVGVVGVGQDITERKQAEDALSRERLNLEQTVTARTSELRQSLKQLEEADRHKSRFLSTMSHELRTPLNAILGFTDLLDGKFFGELNEKQHDYVRQIDGSGQHLLALINDLLDVAKIDAGAVELDFGPVDLSDTISGVVNMMAAQFRQKEITVETHIEPELPTVHMDVRRARQILLNILSNAHKYTPDDGIIEISVTTADDNRVRVDISDSGIGLEKAHLANVFSEFYQADRVRDENLGGTGIGLALTRRLVELQNGEIGAHCPARFQHSQKPKGARGATFWFTIPYASHRTRCPVR